MVEAKLFKPILPQPSLYVLPVIIVALSLLYSVYNVANVFLLISVIIVASLYLVGKHPSFYGLVVHLAVMFSLQSLYYNYVVNLVVALILAISLLNYVVGLSSIHEINMSKGTWPLSLLILTYSGFIGALLSFLSLRILYQAIMILVVAIVVGGYRYIILNKRVVVSKRIEINMISGETVNYLIKVQNPTRISLYYWFEDYNRIEDLKIALPRGLMIVEGTEDYIPVEISSDIPGIHRLSLRIIFEDNYRLVRLYRDITLYIKIAPKTKIALLAAHRLISRLPREVVEQAPGRRPSSIILNPRVHVSRRGEYYGARQYVPGDDLSQIHWKKSLSKLTLISKERRQSYSPSIIILADTCSYDNRDYANILYTLVSTLISISLQDPLRIVSLAIYDVNQTYLLILEDYAARVLYRVVKNIEEGKISSTRVPRKTLDKNIASLLASIRNEKISSLYDYIIGSIKEKYMWRNVLALTERTFTHNVMIIHGDNIVSDAYTLVEYILLRKGFNVQKPPKIPPRILYERVLEEPVGVK